MKFGVDFMKIKAISFNIRNCDDIDGNSVKERAPRLSLTMAECDADVIGLQEYKPRWKKHIKKFCGKTFRMYVKYRDPKTREATPVFWNKKKFACIKKGYFWLSDTPRKRSKGWDEKYDCYRICTYVILKDRLTGKKFTFINTHFGFGDAGQVKSAELIYKMSKEISPYPTFVTGDFNMEPDSPGYKTMASLFSDADISEDGKTKATCHDYGKKSEHIDYCFIDENITSCGVEILDKTFDGKYPSDHYGLFIKLDL